MITRLTVRYVLLFLVVLIALDVVAYLFIGTQYRAELAPALGTPEVNAAYVAAMRHVASTIALFDLPLLVIVTIVSYLFAQSTIEPLQASRERERRFAADAAHELRSPLATIASVAQASRGASSYDADAAFDLIARTALDASAIVADLMTLAREPALQALHLEPIDVAIVARHCLAEIEPQAKAKSIALDAQLRHAIVDADERRIRELFRNLLDNALKHAKSCVRISTLQEGKHVIIGVADDGGGVNADQREEIFSRFVRLDPTKPGSGLGLAIGRWIARAHGGDLRLGDSNGLPGANFIASLPAHE